MTLATILLQALLRWTSGRAVALMMLAAILPACSEAPLTVPGDEGTNAPATDQAETDAAGAEQPGATSAAEPTALAIEFTGDTQPSGDSSLAVMRTRVAEQERAAGRGPTATPTPGPQLITSAETIAAPTLGLMWQRSAAGEFSYDDAGLYCRNLRVAGHDDWRLPSISELERLISSHPASQVPVRRLWSSTPHQIRGWLAYDLEAAASTQLTAEPAHVICVRKP